MPHDLPFLPFKSDAKDAPAYWFLDLLWIVHVTGEQTEGRYSVVEQYMPQGSGPPPHDHPFPRPVSPRLEEERLFPRGSRRSAPR